MIFKDDILEVLNDKQKYKVWMDTESKHLLDVNNLGKDFPYMGVIYYNDKYFIVNDHKYVEEGKYLNDPQEMQFVKKKVISIGNAFTFTNGFINSVLKRYDAFVSDNPNLNFYEFLHILAYEDRLSQEDYIKICDPKFRRVAASFPKMDKEGFFHIDDIVEEDDPCYNKDIDTIADKIYKINSYQQLSSYAEEIRKTKSNFTNKVKFNLPKRTSNIHGEISTVICNGKKYIAKKINNTFGSGLNEFITAKYMGDIGIGPRVYDYETTDDQLIFYMDYLDGKTYNQIYENKEKLNIVSTITAEICGRTDYKIFTSETPSAFVHLNRKAMRFGAILEDRNRSNFIRLNESGEWKMIDFDDSELSKYNGNSYLQMGHHYIDMRTSNKTNIEKTLECKYNLFRTKDSTVEDGKWFKLFYDYLNWEWEEGGPDYYNLPNNTEYEFLENKDIFTLNNTNKNYDVYSTGKDLDKYQLLQLIYYIKSFGHLLNFYHLVNLYFDYANRYIFEFRTTKAKKDKDKIGLKVMIKTDKQNYIITNFQ